MVDTLEHTEQVAAQLLAAGFQHSWGDTLMEGVEHGIRTNEPPTSTMNPSHPYTSSRGRPRNGRGVSSLPADSSLHPIIRLGWKSLCSVVCNGLHGEFLGGHDRDMFIQVISGHYAGLPLVDVSMGGCIMTCSQFERAAGRELSKKWKESIHVVGEGEGSRATLLSWLKRTAERDFGNTVVGKKVWVCWCADAEYYQGTIVAYNKDSGKHTVQYSNRLVEDLHLGVELISFSNERPLKKAISLPANTATTTTTNTMTTTLMTTPLLAKKRTTTPIADAHDNNNNNNDDYNESSLPVSPDGVLSNQIWHQNSGASVSSQSDELKAAASLSFGAAYHGDRMHMAHAPAAIPPAPVRGGLRSAGTRRPRGTLQRTTTSVAANDVAFLSSSDFSLPPPKRTVSAPAAVLLAEAAAANATAALAEVPEGNHYHADVAPTTTTTTTSTTPMMMSPIGGDQHHHHTNNNNNTKGTHNIQLDPLTPGVVMPHQSQAFAPSPPRTIDTAPAAMDILPPPPPTHFVEDCDNASSPASIRVSERERSQQVNAMVKWMHGVVLALDWELEGGFMKQPGSLTEAAVRAGVLVPPHTAHCTSTSTAAASSTASAQAAISISGRFQALLALLRGHSIYIEGLFEAMSMRYSFFTSNPALQKRKLAEFIIATVHEAALVQPHFAGMHAARKDNAAAAMNVNNAAKDNNTNNNMTAMLDDSVTTDTTMEAVMTL